MTGDCHVRFCETEGEVPPATHQNAGRSAVESMRLRSGRAGPDPLLVLRGLRLLLARALIRQVVGEDAVSVGSRPRRCRRGGCGPTVLPFPGADPLHCERPPAVRRNAYARGQLVLPFAGWSPLMRTLFGTCSTRSTSGGWRRWPPGGPGRPRRIVNAAMPRANPHGRTGARTRRRD